MDMAGHNESSLNETRVKVINVGFVQDYKQQIRGGLTPNGVGMFLLELR